MDELQRDCLIQALQECVYETMSNRTDYGSIRWDVENVKLMNEIESTIKDYIKCSD